MKKTNILLVLVLSLLIVIGINGSINAQEEIKLRLAHISAANSPQGICAEKVAELVGAETNGRVKIEVFHAAQLGGMREEVDGVIKGTIDMIVDGSGFATTHLPQYDIINMYYLMEDKEHLLNVMRGTVGDILAARYLGKNGVRFLDQSWAHGSRHLASTKPVKSLADLQNLRIRVPEVQMWVGAWESLGASATPTDFAEAHGALSQGIIDAVELPLDYIYEMGFYEIAPYITLTGHLFAPRAIFAINEKVYQDLPFYAQYALQKAVEEAGKLSNQLIDEAENGLIEKLKEAGATIYTINKDELREVVNKFNEEYAKEKGWEELYNAIIESK